MSTAGAFETTLGVANVSFERLDVATTGTVTAPSRVVQCNAEWCAIEAVATAAHPITKTTTARSVNARMVAAEAHAGSLGSV